MTQDNDAITMHQSFEDTDIVCAVSEMPAELFVRIPEGRLVPLTQHGLKNFASSLTGLQKHPSSHDEKLTNYTPVVVSLEEGKSEYFMQAPTPGEKKRRELSQILKYYSIERIFWSPVEITREDIARNLGGDKNIDDYVLSEIRGYTNPNAALSRDNVHVVVIANAALEEDKIRTVWDSTIRPRKASGKSGCVVERTIKPST